MKHTKKLLAFLTAIVMFITLLPFPASAVTKSKSEQLIPENLLSGFQPIHAKGNRTLTEAYLAKERRHADEPNAVNLPYLPSRYDSRDDENGILTPVYYQEMDGPCWAFSTTSPIETYMIKHGIIDQDTGRPATSSINLSEYHLMWFNYRNAYDKLGLLTGDRSAPYGTDFIKAGGNGYMATFTLMRWAGPASESVPGLAFSDLNENPSKDFIDPSYAYQFDGVHIESIEWIPCSNREAIKKAILEYGAGSISYCASNSYYNPATYAYCNKITAYGNHAVTVVGWDDDFSRNNFSPASRPSANGAWICKNSWGSDWGEDGYFYLSYEDRASSLESCFFFTVSDKDNYTNCYQYDGTNSLNTVITPFAIDSGSKIANVFPVQDRDEILKAVALCILDEAVTYTLEIYKDVPDPKNPSGGEKVLTQTGSIQYPGYYTIPLDAPVLLSSGSRFSVVFTLNSSPSGDGSVYLPYDASGHISWAQWYHVDRGDTSFYMDGSGTWQDCPNSGDFRIKAYTDPRYTVASVSNNSEFGTISSPEVTLSGVSLTAIPAEGCYLCDCEIVNGSANFTIDGNNVLVDPSSDCTIRFLFAQKPTFQIRFENSGTTLRTETAQLNDQITLPSFVDQTPLGWSFCGWSQELIPETNVKPAYYAKGASYTVTNNATFYAVYIKEEYTNSTVYQRVNEAMSDWTGNYVITGGSGNDLYALKSLSGKIKLEDPSGSPSSVQLQNTGMTQNGNQLVNAPSEYVFTVAASGSYYTILGSTGYWIGVKDQYPYNLPSNATGCNWTLTYDSNAGCMRVKTPDSIRFPFLWHNGKSFALNRSSTAIQFWKESRGVNNSYSTGTSEYVHVHEMQTIPGTPATCLNAGTIAHFLCVTCGKRFLDSAGQNETTLESTQIRATGLHVFSAWAYNGNGTHSRICSACGTTETNDCSYKNVVTPPTPTDRGFTTHTCTVCGYSFKDSFVDPIGIYYDIAFSVPDGIAPLETMTCKAESPVTLPRAEAPEGCEFVGWVAAEVEQSTTSPSQIYLSSYQPTGNVTLYALYTFCTGDPTPFYIPLSSAPRSWEGSYLITAGTAPDSLYLLKGLPREQLYESAETNSAVPLADSGVLYDDGRLMNVSSPYLFTVSSVGSYYSICSASTKTYVGNYDTYLYSLPSCTPSSCYWSFAYNTASGTITATNSTTTDFVFLGFSPENRYFTTATEDTNSIRFWKEAHEDSYAVYYATTPVLPQNPDEPEEPIPGSVFTVSFSVPDGVSPTPSVTVEGSSVISLPIAEAPEDCVFIGWVKNEVVSSASLPGNVLTGSYTVTKDTHLHALYSYNDGDDPSYRRLYFTPTDWSGNYVITSTAADGSVYVLNALSGNTRYESSASGGARLLSEAGILIDGDCLYDVPKTNIFKIAKVSNTYYSIQSASSNTYVSVVNSYLSSRTSYIASYCRWSFSVSDGVVRVKTAANTKYSYLALSSDNYFALSKSAPTTVAFWKESGGAVLRYSTFPG